MGVDKRILLGVMFLLSFAFMLSVASALTWVNPIADGTIKGSVNFNVSTGITNVLNCTLSQGSTAFARITNDTANQPSFNVTNNTAVFTQSSSSSFVGACSNATVSETATITGVAVDNNNPVCSFDTDFENTNFQSQLGISTLQLSSDTTTNLNYTWTLYTPAGDVKRTSAASAPTFSDTDFDDIGDFIVELNVTDQASNSNICTNKTITVGTDGKKTVAVTAAVQQQKSDNTALFFILGAFGFIAFMAVVGFVAISLGKKSKR